MKSIAPRLIGRDRELQLLAEVVERAIMDGEMLLLSGDPGVGKTALLDAAEVTASTLGALVLRAAGVEFEAGIAFSGLNQVLLPLSGRIVELAPLHRNALNVALGLSDGEPADVLVVGMAALMLLRLAATERPLVLIVDDVQWLDRSTATVLGFLARRLAGSPIGLITATRSWSETYLDRSGLPEEQIGVLEPEPARELLDAAFPDLVGRVRERVFTEAQGNPLALLELPRGLSSSQRTAARPLPRDLPLSHRIQALFESQIVALPRPTQDALLLAAVEGTGDLRVMQAAGGASLAVNTLAAAEQAGLVHIDLSAGHLAFRHPLIRAAVIEGAASADRRRCHRVLAPLLMDQVERRAWHLGEAAVGPDEEAASCLESAADLMLRRGDPVGAIGTLVKSADLSPDGADRSRRLAQAAYIGTLGIQQAGPVSSLLDDARHAGLDKSGSLLFAAAGAIVLVDGDGDVETAHRLVLGALQSRAETLDSNDLSVTAAVSALAHLCFLSQRLELWEEFHKITKSLIPSLPLEIRLYAAGMADPARMSRDTLVDLDGAIRNLDHEPDPLRVIMISSAGRFVDRMHECRGALGRVSRDAANNDAVGNAILALMLLASDSYERGDWDNAVALNDEGIQLCQASGSRFNEWGFRSTAMFIAAGRGETDTLKQLTDELVNWGTPRQVGIISTYVHKALSLAALGNGDYEEAYQQATFVTQPGAITSHAVLAHQVGFDLVESAAKTGRIKEAREHVHAMQKSNIGMISARLNMMVKACEAVVSDEEAASDIFNAALAVPGIGRWSFDVARVQLAYGECLRRMRSNKAARMPLSASAEVFRRLGAKAWEIRATNELRATGVTRSGARAEAKLTPQELEIASLAAAGLSNKEIGARLFLSPRTVGAHLYRVFPKLGIRSRAALRDALAASNLTPESSHPSP